MKTNIARINELINDYGSCSIVYSSSVSDYLFNGKKPYKINTDHFQIALGEFYRLCAKQLSENKFDKNKIKIIIDNVCSKIENNNQVRDTHRVSFLLDKSAEKLTIENEQTHELINSILYIQKRFLQQLLSFLQSVFDDVNYILEEDIKKMLYEFDKSDDKSIQIPSLGCLRINMNKKDAINFLTLMEYLDVISFKETNRNRFIETYFTYSHKGLSKPIKSMNSDLANLHDTKGEIFIRNNKTMSAFIDNLIEKLNGVDNKEYMKWLKSSI
jgi:hypothetical protein